LKLRIYTGDNDSASLVMSAGSLTKRIDVLFLGRIQGLHKGGSVSDHPRRELLEGLVACSPGKILKFISSEMRFPAPEG